MEKSMVHELNPLVASNVQYNRSSFIHTVYETDFNQLRKSRIQNLPNYRKEDLSGKMNFVVVFQSIQIERLSVQIQTLRMKLKDYERQICNYQNYEVQIRQLTQKCHSYQMQRQDHQQAMQKMHKICQQLYNQLEEMRARYADIDLSLKEKYRLQKDRCQGLSHELQKWKARYNASETSKAKQLQDMKLMLQNQRKSMLQREIREISVKYESERSMLQNQLRKLRQNLENRNGQIQRMRFDLDQSKVRQGQLRQYQSRLDEYQDKLMMMAQQNMRLNQLLRMKKQEIQTLKNNERNLQNRLENLKKIQQQFNQVNKRIQSYEVQIREWNQKYSRLEAQNNRNQILSNKAQQYQRLLDNSAEQMEKMNTIIRQKISQIEKWKSQNQRLMIQLQQSRSVQTKITEYEETLSQMANENQRLNQILRARLEQIQNWKSKYSDIQSKLPLLTQSQSECKNLKQKLTTQINNRANMSQIIASLEQDLSKAAQMEQTLLKEKNSNKDLQKQIQRLNGAIRNLSNQNNDFSKKVQSLEGQLRQNSGIIDELNECKRRINLMTQQLDRINGIIHEKIQQIKQLKENYNSVSINTARYRQIEEQFVANLQQTEQLVLKLDQSRRQNQCVQQKLLTAEGRCKRLESELFSNNQEKQKLIGIISQKKIQLEDLVGRVQKADQKISLLQQMEQQAKNLKSSYSQLDQKFKQMQNRYSKQIKRSQSFSNQVESLTNEVFKLKTQSNFSKQFVSEFLNIKSQAQEKDRLIISLMEKISSVQKYIALLKQQNKKNYNNMCQHNNKWTSLNSNFQVVSDFMDKLFQLQVKIEKLSNQNFKLQNSVHMMNIEMAQSTYASQNSYKKIEQQRMEIVYPQNEKIVMSLAQSKALVNSPSTKLTAIQQDSCYKQSSSKIIEPTKNSPSNSNYYQSQVRQLYSNNTNGYTPGIYSNIQQNSYYQNQNPKITQSNMISHTIRTLRPGSNVQTTSNYVYSSNYGNNNFRSNYGSSQVINSNMIGNGNVEINADNTTGTAYSSHINHHFNNLTNFEKPNSFIKQNKQHSASEIRKGSDSNEQINVQQSQGRRYVLSPVRFLN